MSSNTNSSSPDDVDVVNSNGGFKLKRLMHNDTERKRKKRMIEVIDNIVELLPMKCTGKTSRINRLEQLHSYILELRNKNDALMFANPSSVFVQEILQLKKYIDHLESLNRNYLNLLKLAGISSASAVEMGDRDWKKPLKYSNTVFLDSNKSTATLKDLTKTNKLKGSTDDEEESDESETSESENRSSVSNGMFQLVNPLPLQPPAPPVQYVLLSTGLNTPAQLVPICSTPILPSANPSLFLSNNLSATPRSSQISLAKVHQDNSINIKVTTDKKSPKKKKTKTKRKISEEITTSESKSCSTDLSAALTTTIEKCQRNAPESSENDAVIEAKDSGDHETKTADSEGQSGKRGSVPVERLAESNCKKAKTSESVQSTSPASTQVRQQANSVTPSANPEKLNHLGKPTSTRAPMSSTSQVVYQVDDDSNDSRLTTPTNTQPQPIVDKSTPSNSTSTRCNYSTESLLQQPVETQVNTRQSSSESSALNQPQQSSQNDQTASYQQQQQSVPSFTVKDSLINSSPTITSANSSVDKHNFDLNSSITSLCSAKRNLAFDFPETLGISASSATTPNLFDPMLSIAPSDSQQLISSFVPSWPTEPSASHNSVSSGSVNASSGSQPYGNANASSVLFANQPPFSLLSTTPTPFDTSVSNVSVFGASPHKAPAPSNSSSAFNNFIPDLSSMSSYVLTNNEDQHSQSVSSIGDSFPRSTRSIASVSSSRTPNSRSGTTNNTTVPSSTTSSYSKSKASSSKPSTSTTSSMSTRNTKSSASNSKKGSAKSSSTATSTLTDPKFSQATTMSSTSTTANLFSRHHPHSHPTHTPHRPLPNDNYFHHIIPELISNSAPFLSVTSVAGHSTSVMSSSTASSAPPAFHPHPHAHHSHQFAHASYSNFFTPSQTDQSTGGLSSSYDNRSYESSLNPNDSSTTNDLTDNNQLSSYPIFRPQSQSSHSFAATSTSSSYQPGSSTSSTSHTRNFANPPPMYPHHHHSSASNHVTNFNIGYLLPDSTLSSPGSGAVSGYGASEFLSTVSKSQTSKSNTSSTNTSTSSSTSIVSNTGLPKFAQLTKSLPPSVSSSIVDPLPSSSAYQNAAPPTAPHLHQYHPATHHPFYPSSQTSVTYSSSHPLNPHFASSSSSQNRNHGRGNSGFMTTDELDPSSSSNTRSSSLTAHHYYPIPPHNTSAADVFTNQSTSHHNQSLGSHHLSQHNHFASNASSTHTFNQASTAPTSVPNFNIQSSINTSTSGTTPAFGAASSAATHRMQFPFQFTL